MIQLTLTKAQASDLRQLLHLGVVTASEQSLDAAIAAAKSAEQILSSAKELPDDDSDDSSSD